MNKQEKKWVYIIDDNFQLIYSNDELKNVALHSQFGQPCYQVICQKDRPCKTCPLQEANQGKANVFNQLHKKWVNVSASRIEWPGVGKCHMVICDVAKDGEKLLADITDLYHIEQTTDYGLYNRESFFRHTEERLHSSEDTKWCLISIDIEKFQLFNEWYDRQVGDKLLTSISDCLMKYQKQNLGIAGWFGDDDFAFLMKRDQKQIKELCDAVSAQIKLHSGKMHVLPAFGIYEITDVNDSVYKIYDRAKLACSAVKGNYTTRIKYFEHQMLEALESELLLLADIQNAFRKKEFTFVLQPKCNMKNGKIVGAEALARWNNAEKGMISPAVFIPFLEKSGLISELDTYIWEEVCIWQRSMLDRGQETIPVSVNISRVDICSIDVPEYFDRLIQKYDLDPQLIELEITESAYAEDIDAINIIVEKLRKSGFCVLMDDFGSAYSSLNMLKDISLDVIKMDMRFLDLNDSNADKGVNILETVCNMAHILGMGIIAEGVENDEQKNLLLKNGCNCGQGFYFYRPLPVSDFEEVLHKTEALKVEEVAANQPEMFYLKDLMNKNMLSQSLLNNMLGAVAFYDVCGSKITVVRYNEQYAEIFGDQKEHLETRRDFGEQLYEEEHERIFEMFDNACKNRNIGASADVRRRKADGTDMWLHLRVFFLYQRDGHTVFYSSVTDATEIHKANMTLQFLNNDMPGGYYRHKNNENGDFTHISQRFLDIFGFTREEIKTEFDDKFINMVHPEDRKKVLDCISSMQYTGGNYQLSCRMRSKNGYIAVTDQSRLVQFGNQEVFQGILLCNMDYYMWLQDDAQNITKDDTASALMPCGVFCSEADDGHHFSYISNSMLEMLGYTRQEFEKKFQDSTENMVYEGDRERITEEIFCQIQSGNFTSCEYRIEMADGSLKWVYSRSRLTCDANGKRWFYTCIVDHDYLKEKYQIQEWQHMKYQSLLEIPGILVYDYDPLTDKLTIEFSLKNGERQQIVAENYVEKIREHAFISEDCIEEQRKRLLEATEHPVNRVTELKGHFLNESEEWYRFHYTSLVDEHGKVYRIVGRGENITAERSHMSLLQSQATKDTLTGLLKYECAKEQAEHMLEMHQGGTLLLVDIDNFKEVNDTLGHLAGDELLKQIAEIIHDSFRKEDISARFGGDEFLVFMPELIHRETITARTDKFLEKISKISVSEHMNVQCSIGIATVDESEIAFNELFHKADMALYVSKRNGKNRYTFFEE